MLKRWREWYDDDSVLEVKLTKYTLTLFVATIFVAGLFFAIIVIGEISQRNREIERHRKTIQNLESEVKDKNLKIQEKDVEIRELQEYKNILDAVRDLSSSKLSEKEELEIASAIRVTSERYRYNWRLTTAMIMTESSFRPNIESRDPSYGLMQIKLRTAKEVAPKVGLKVRNKKELMKISTNVTIGSTYLLDQIIYFKDVKKAIIAYNLGPTKTRRIEKRRGEFETEYFVRIIKNYNYLKEQYKT